MPSRMLSRAYIASNKCILMHIYSQCKYSEFYLRLKKMFSLCFSTKMRLKIFAYLIDKCTLWSIHF